MPILASVLPEQKQEKPKKKNRSYKRYAGKINVRIIEYRKEIEDSLSRHKEFSSRLLIVDDAHNRQYQFPIDISPKNEEQLGHYLVTTLMPGILPSPEAWTQKTENILFMLKDGFEFYHEHHVQIGNVVKESV